VLRGDNKCPRYKVQRLSSRSFSQRTYRLAARRCRAVILPRAVYGLAHPGSWALPTMDKGNRHTQSSLGSGCTANEMAATNGFINVRIVKGRWLKLTGLICRIHKILDYGRYFRQRSKLLPLYGNGTVESLNPAAAVHRWRLTRGLRSDRFNSIIALKYIADNCAAHA